jgi:hypothetical protein
MSSYIQNYRSIHKDIASPETKTYYINVDSRFKVNPTGPDSDFAVNLVTPIKNVTKVRVASVEFPNVPYSISEYLGNNKLQFQINTSPYTIIKTVVVPDGNYTSEELLNFLNRELQPEFAISLDTITGKVRIFPASYGSAFRMVLDPEGRFDSRDTDYGLGYNLGFRERAYNSIGATGIKSESIMNIVGFNYYILQINGYDTLQSPASKETVIGMAKLIMDGDHFSVIFEDGRNLLSYVYEFYQPIDFKRVEVKVLDPFGEPVFPLRETMSLTLEVTSIMQSYLYEQQRTRMFQVPGGPMA